MKEEFDFESIKNKAIEQLKAGKPLLGKDGAFAPLLESILNAALEGEMDAHLTEEERQMGNRRNGKMQKQDLPLYCEIHLYCRVPLVAELLTRAGEDNNFHRPTSSFPVPDARNSHNGRISFLSH